jgi:uncharacterized delta-60 repeat protein/LPXTG-motif cell wall-anchored protein
VSPTPWGKGHAALAVDSVTEVTPYTSNVGTSLGTTSRATAVQPDGKILVGGGFSGFLRRFNADGTVDTAFNTNASAVVTNTVFGIGVQSDGKIIVVGGTQSVSGFVKRLNADGTSDTAFNTNVGTTYNTTLMWAVAVQIDGKILVGGDVSGYLKRLNTTGTLDSAFNTNVGSNLNGTVTSIALYPGDAIIAVAGAFSGYLKSFSSTGAVNTSFNANVGSSLDGGAYAVTFLSSGSVVVGGLFTGKLKRYSSAGVIDTTYNSAVSTLFDGAVRGLAADLGTWDGVVVVGAFTGKIKRLMADGTVNGVINSSALDGNVLSVVFPCSQIAIAGLFTGGSRRFLVDQDWAWSPTPSDTTRYSGCWTPKNATRTKTLSNGLEESIGVAGANTTMWEIDRTLNAAAILGQPGQFFNDEALNEYGVRVNVIGTGCAPGVLCTNRGALTLSFSQPVTNPIISLAAIGGAWAYGTGWTEMDVTTPGVTLTKLNGTNIQVVNSTHIEPATKNPNIECNAIGNTALYGQSATAACGSIQANGTFTSLTFALSTNTRSNTANSATSVTFTDAILVSVHVQEDFGLLPTSYDTPSASHVVGQLQLGSSISPDQTTLIYPTTNVDAVSAGTSIGNVDDDAAVWGTSVSVGTIGSSYTVPVALSGVSATANLCGWIDFNINGTFEVGERACATNPVSGDTSANLTWTIPNDAVAGATYARLRLSYSDISSPTGKVDSGEVEDYSLSIVLAATTTTTTSSSLAPTTTIASVTTTIAASSTTLAPSTTTTIASTTTVASTTTSPPVTVAVATTTTTTTSTTTTTVVRVAATTTTTTLPPRPAALPDYSVGVQGATQTLAPLGNDTAGNNSHPLRSATIKLCAPLETSPMCSKTKVTVPSEGTFTVNADGTVTFAPEPSFTGVATPRPYVVQDTLSQTTASTITVKVVPPPAPIASIDKATGPQGASLTLSPWLNDEAGIIPTGQSGVVGLVPTSIRLCAPLENAPACTKTSLVTVDGTYTLDTATGVVVFVHRQGFSGTVTQPVTYQISNNWNGLTGIGTTTSLLVPTITPVSSAKVVDQYATTRPNSAAWLTPTKSGVTSQGATFTLSSLRLYNAQSHKWVTSITTADGQWTVIRGSVRFIPRNGFVGSTHIPFHISDSAGHLVRAVLHVSVGDISTLPLTGQSSNELVMWGGILLSLGWTLRRRRFS